MFTEEQLSMKKINLYDKTWKVCQGSYGIVLRAPGEGFPGGTIWEFPTRQAAEWAKKVLEQGGRLNEPPTCTPLELDISDLPKMPLPDMQKWIGYGLQLSKLKIVRKEDG
jgi:hypothetical protein